MEYLALLIPAIISLILYLYLSRYVVWWELLIPSVTALLFILIIKYTAQTVMVHDTEYWGVTVVQARYYEYWETWVVEECSEQYACGSHTEGSGKDARTVTDYCTRYYDCSHNAPHQAYWEAVDQNGNTYNIPQEQYNRLIKKWSATPTFVDQNRDILFSHGHGQDGDMYFIKWNGLPETSESAVSEHSYTNKVQASHTSFKLPTIKKEEADSLGLHQYPGYYDVYKQSTVLGLQTIYTGYYLDSMETLFQYINGYYGPKNHVKVFVCLFYNKPYEIAFKQEAFWDGGNQNEVVVCIGLDKATKEIQWVKPFSWTQNNRMLVDIREDIAELKTFQPVEVYKAIAKSINGDVHRSFKKDFSYLEVDLPTWSYWVLYLGTTAITLLLSWWIVTNDFNNPENEKEPWNRNVMYQRKKSLWDLIKEGYNAAKNTK